MKYAIIETQDDEEILVGYCSNDDQLLKIIQNQHQETDGCIIKTDAGYDLVNKVITETKGLLYGVKQTTIITRVKSWRLISIDLQMSELHDFNEFDLTDALKGSNGIMLISMNGSGKTRLIKKIMDTTNVSFITNSLIIGCNSDNYKDKYPNATILDEWDDDDVNNYLSKSGNAYGAIILEYGALVNQKLSYLQKQIIFHHKYYNKSLIITSQYAARLPPDARYQFNYFFLFGNNSDEYKKKLYDCYDRMFPNSDQFIANFDRITKNYGCMVIDNSKAWDQESTFKLTNN